MNDIEKIQAILRKISTNDDRINVLSKEEWLKMINQDGYDIEEVLTLTDSRLKEKYQGYTDDKAFFRDCLYEYASKVIPLIKKDYENYLDNGTILQLDNLISENKITIKDTEKMENISEKDKGYYGGGAHSDGTIDISMPQGDIIRKTRRQLGVLLHEIFHLTHKWRTGIDLNYMIDGTKAKALNYGGILMEEGLTEKCAIDFARKYNLPCKPSYSYYLYVELVAKIEEFLQITNGDLFNTNYRELFERIDKSGKLLEQYELTELYRYTSFFQKTKDNNITFNYNGKTYTAINYPELSEEAKKASSINEKSSKLTNILERKALLKEYAMILQEIKRRKELDNPNLTNETENKSRGTINIFTCILLVLGISIITFAMAYFFIAK